MIVTSHCVSEADLVIQLEQLSGSMPLSAITIAPYEVPNGFGHHHQGFLLIYDSGRPNSCPACGSKRDPREIGTYRDGIIKCNHPWHRGE